VDDGSINRNRTRALGGGDSGGAGPRRGVRLCVLAHPDPLRVGTCSWLDGLEGGVQVLVGRTVPEFRAGRSGPLLPLGDPCVSRKTAWLRWVGGSLEITPIPGATSIRIAGRGLVSPVRIAGERLSSRGVLMEIAGRVLLSIDQLEDDEKDDLGFVGVTRGARELRASIRAYARLDVPVLIVGEAGTGKGLVARALHRSGPRAAGPWVALGSADGPGALDDAFEASTGGTLLIDRIGELLPESQRELLGRLEHQWELADGRGARLVATTDTDPEELVARGAVGRSLLDRLQVGLLYIPALRHRRADLVLLLHRFVAEELVALGAGERLAPPEGQRQPWLTLDLVYEILEHRFPGNVRELRNLCGQIAVHSADREHAEIPPAARERLRRFDRWTETDEPSEGGEVAKIGSPRLSAPRVRAVLAAARWNLAAAARELGVARNTLVSFIERTPGFRRVKDIPDSELRAAVTRLGRDAEALAADLEVSPHGLRIRLSTLE
jgi:transcriptional regulator with AAA-type ATPase domain